jgi:hypothetical protein
MTSEELKQALTLHKQWLDNEPTGKRLDLSNADLSYANLRNANLRCVTIRGADLSYADLRSVTLSGASLRNADLSGADLRGANIRNLVSAQGVIGADLQVIDMPRQSIVRYGKQVSIGCEGPYDIDYWLEHARAIGERNNYNRRDTELYIDMLTVLKKVVTA